MATIAAIATVGAAGFSAYSSNSSAKKQQKNVKDQIKEARRIREENKGYTNKGFDDIIGLIDGYKSIPDFLDEGEDIGRDMMDYRMDYVLGDTQDELRDSQRINASLGAYDFSDVNSSISKILKSNFYDIASITRDMPTGSFANLSVQNIANLAQQGLQNSISTGEYISQVSGVDQYTPYRVAQDLFTIERDRAGQKIQATNNKTNQLIGTNNEWFANYSDLSNASMAIEAGRNAATISAVNSAAGAISGWATSRDSSRLQAKQENYYDSLIQRYSTQQSGGGGGGSAGWDGMM